MQSWCVPKRDFVSKFLLIYLARNRSSTVRHSSGIPPLLLTTYTDDYYDPKFHFCKPDPAPVSRAEGLGAILFGDRIFTSPYEVRRQISKVAGPNQKYCRFTCCGTTTPVGHFAQYQT